MSPEFHFEEEFNNYISNLDSRYTYKKINSDQILQDLFIESQDIILVYKEEKAIGLAQCASGESEKIKYLEKIQDDGSPLQAPFSLKDLSIVGGTEQSAVKTERVLPKALPFEGIPLQHANMIISKYNSSPSTTCLPIYIVTNGQDVQKTILMGTQKKDSWITSMIANLVEGNAKVDDLLDQHMSRCAKLQVSSLVKSVFQENGIDGNRHVKLELNWETPTMEVPVSEARTNMIINCQIGRPNYNITHLWNQIKLLRKYVDMLHHLNSNIHSGAHERLNCVLPTLYEGAGVLPENLDQSPPISVKCLSETHNKLIDIIQSDKHIYNIAETKRLQNQPKECEEETLLSEICNQMRSTETSRPLDLTDKLYNALLDCYKYQDLTSCFQIIFQKLRNNVKEGSKINVSSKKSSRFVCAVRNLQKGDKSNPEVFWDHFELFIEMGLEKLRDDYSYIFVKTSLANEELLLPPPEIPAFLEMSLEDRVASMYSYINYLVNLHVKLSVLLEVDYCIKIAHTTLINIANNVFTNIQTTYDELLNNDFAFRYICPVSTVSIKDFVTGSAMFSSWRLHLESNNYNRICASTTLLTTNPLQIDPAFRRQNIESTLTLSNLSPFHRYQLRSNAIKFGKFNIQRKN